MPQSHGRLTRGQDEQWLLERMDSLERDAELLGESEVFYMNTGHTHVCIYVHVYVY